MGWRDDATKVLKKALVGATEPKKIREIASALQTIQPYEVEGSEGRPMPVRIVKPKPKKKWTFPKKKGK